MNEEKFNAGAIWHGPWHTGLAAGSFGAPGNYHWAMALGQHTLKSSVQKKEKAFFPFTSKKNGSAKTVLILQPGTAPFGDKTRTSYLLAFRLVARKTDLERRFKFCTRISDELYQEAIHNYQKILSARKRHK